MKRLSEPEGNTNAHFQTFEQACKWNQPAKAKSEQKDLMEQDIQKINKEKCIHTRGNTVRIAEGYSKDIKVLELALKKLQDIYENKTNARRSKYNQRD